MDLFRAGSKIPGIRLCLWWSECLVTAAVTLVRGRQHQGWKVILAGLVRGDMGGTSLEAIFAIVIKIKATPLLKVGEGVINFNSGCKKFLKVSVQIKKISSHLL